MMTEEKLEEISQVFLDTVYDTVEGLELADALRVIAVLKGTLGSIEWGLKYDAEKQGG